MNYRYLLATFFSTSLLLSAGGAAWSAEKSIADFVNFAEIPDEDCEKKGGLRIVVQNLHDKEVIDMHLDRFFSDVRQGGRSMFALAPRTQQPLGCSKVFEARQHWELVSAEAVTRDHANARYGEIYGVAISE
ncbi:hypothetical protein Q7C_2115 [Methylophaga frappieri]|uniref:Uncharacterized protein n=1 Tax=Methylophaga frappieri (strain ATCC BAA-2434 / DSM 25690 / JAM7) TaxID=754477 RepID=I1YK08_METFJ|nr:hypothetical protein [Methylophaga frappieri]AFJ03251.1 hypothetical protein Q7C_2115 [Methylophaga frappieri]